MSDFNPLDSNIGMVKAPKTPDTALGSSRATMRKNRVADLHSLKNPDIE
jgi:hypothetical protein